MNAGDLLQLTKGGPSAGGKQCADRILALLVGDHASPGFAADGVVAKPEPLGFKGGTTIQARGEALSVQIDHDGRSWAVAFDLLEHYEIPHAWVASLRQSGSVHGCGAQLPR